MGTLILRPDGVGTYSQLTPYGDTPNWKCVDDITPDNDSTYVAENTDTGVDTYEMEDHTAETGAITNVRVYIRAKKVGGDGSARCAIRPAGIVYYGSVSINFAWNDYYYDWATNPGGGSWTWTHIDNLQAGVELTYIAGAPRCTQVWIVVTYTPLGTSDRNVSVDIDHRSYRNVSVDVEIETTSDRSVSVDIIFDTFELCYYDTGNNRWTDGSYGGVRVRIVDKTTSIKKSEELNKLSSLKFDIFDYNENWGIEEGAIIALANSFSWSGTPGASSSAIGKFLFQGQVVKIEKSTPSPEGEYDIKIEAVHCAHTLAEQYVNYLITVIRAYRGGDEKLCTSAYHIKELLGDATYYDEAGSPTTMPMYIRRDNEYLKHKEYIDKNKLEVLLDICKNSNNVFYCHNDAFYFEPKKPMLMASYYTKTSWEQNYNNINFDSTFDHLNQEPLLPNTWDISSSETCSNYFYVPFRNTSPYTQNCVGVSFWGGLFVDSPTENLQLYNMTNGRTIGSSVSTTYIWSPNSTTDVEICRNTLAFNSGNGHNLSANIAYAVRFFMTDNANDQISYGTHYPSRVFYPFGLHKNDTTQLWRGNFTMPIHILMADQIRWFEPQIPPRFIMYNDGTQLDQFFVEGWNPDLDAYCLSGYLHLTSLWALIDWTSYPHIFLFPRDYNYVSDMSGVTSNAGIDDDISLRDWYDEIQEFEVEFDFINTIDTFNSLDVQEFAICMAFNWDGNGLKDYIMINIKQRSGGGGTDTEFDYVRVSNDTPTSVYNPYTATPHSTSATKCIVQVKFESGTTYMRIGIYCGTHSTWEWQSWTDMGVVSRTGEGIAIRAIKWAEDIGIKYLTIKENYGINALLNNDLMTKKSKKTVDTSSQYIVIGEQNISSGTRIPFGKYPETPDATGPIKIKKLKVYSDEAAQSAARYLYEAEALDTIDIEIYDYLGNYPNEKLKLNKQIQVDSDYYYINKIDFDLTQSVQKLKIKAGSPEQGFYEYLTLIQDETEKKREQDKLNAPLYHEFVMDAAFTADNMQDNTPDEKGNVPGVGGETVFTRSNE